MRGLDDGWVTADRLMDKAFLLDEKSRVMSTTALIVLILSLIGLAISIGASCYSILVLEIDPGFGLNLSAGISATGVLVGLGFEVFGAVSLRLKAQSLRDEAGELATNVARRVTAYSW